MFFYTGLFSIVENVWILPLETALKSWEQWRVFKRDIYHKLCETEALEMYWSAYLNFSDTRDPPLWKMKLGTIIEKGSGDIYKLIERKEAKHHPSENSAFIRILHWGCGANFFEPRLWLSGLQKLRKRIFDLLLFQFLSMYGIIL